MKSGSNSALTIGIILLLVALFLLGGALWLLGNTLVEWWIPVTIAVVPAAVTAMPLLPRWQWLFGFRKAIATLPIHLFFMSSVVFFMLLGVNYWGTDKSTAHTEHTTVVAKFRKEHTRYRRVSRNHRVPDGKYHTWHLTLQFADGRTKNMEVPFSTYRNTRKGATRDLSIERGLFGMQVIKSRQPT